VSTYALIGLVYTRTCPLACGHCIAESSPQARGRMGPEQVRRYLPAIRRFADPVSVTGGEPLLYREIAALTREGASFSRSVVTSGGRTTRWRGRGSRPWPPRGSAVWW
jgi:MoaA/NifB/PqqE/SkfB family radical SAM enzyme